MSVALVPFFMFSMNVNAAAAMGGAGWQTIIAQPGDVIEINSASIERSGSGATAWSRLVLAQAVASLDGNYDVIQVQSFYDCTARQVKTLRRAYFHGETLLREVPVSRTQADMVQVGSIEARMLQMVCQPAGHALAQGEKHELAKEVWLSATNSHPQSNTQPGVPGVVLVVDKSANAKPEKPSLIALPQISDEDKAAADQASANATQKQRAAQQATSARAEPKKPVPSADLLELAPKVAPKSLPSSLAGKATPAPAMTSAASAASKMPERRVESPSDKRLRELIYATSGPRRTSKNPPPPNLAKDLDGYQEKNGVAQQHDWSYAPTAETGPAQWARMKKAYALCASGKRQTPIDIRDGIKVDLDEIMFDYKPAPVRIIDTGRGIQMNVAGGLGVTVGGKRYELRYVTFHRPAEVQVAGKVYDMEMQLVHEAGDGQWMVLALLIEAGSEHPVIQSVLNNLPLEQSIEVAPVSAMDVSRLLPGKRTYWTFMGSLSRPPCMEGVLWLVLKQPIQASADQIAIFSRLHAHNARPIQPANGRLIKESR